MRKLFKPHCCCPPTSPPACVPLSHCCRRLELAPRPSLSVPSTRAFVWNVTNRSSDNLAFWCGSMRRRIDEWRNRFQRGGGPLSSCGFRPGRIILQGFAEESIIHTPESFMRYLSSSSWTVPARSYRQGRAVSPGACHFFSVGSREELLSAGETKCKRRGGGRLFQELLCIFHTAARIVAPG